MKPKSFWGLDGMCTNRLARRTKGGKKGSWGSLDDIDRETENSDKANEGQDQDKVGGKNDC